MPFQPGHKLAPGGKREGAGRKSNKELEAIEAATRVFQKVLTGQAKPIAKHYSKRIYQSDAVLLDARKKLWPDDLEADHGQTINIAIGQSVKVAGPEPELRSDSLQICIGGNNGQNGNGSDGA